MPSSALLSGRVEAVVAMLVIRLGRIGARPVLGLCGALAPDVAGVAGAGRAVSSVSVVQVSLMWALNPFQNASRLALHRVSVS
jgi:hypothetical protein